MNIKELREKHEKEIKEFQDNCKHEDVGDWQDEYWTFAHTTGRKVRYCNICEKKVEIDGKTYWSEVNEKD